LHRGYRIALFPAEPLLAGKLGEEVRQLAESEHSRQKNSRQRRQLFWQLAAKDEDKTTN
jgi:hypothetical protein